MRKPLVYIAGPYRKPCPVQNTRNAAEVGMRLRDTGVAVPLVPHLNLIEGMAFPREPEYWLDATMDQLRCCDAMLRFSDGYSTGADAEEAEAERLGIPVFRTVEQVVEWAKSRLDEWAMSH